MIQVQPLFALGLNAEVNQESINDGEVVEQAELGSESNSTLPILQMDPEEMLLQQNNNENDLNANEVIDDIEGPIDLLEADRTQLSETVPFTSQENTVPQNQFKASSVSNSHQSSAKWQQFCVDDKWYSKTIGWADGYGKNIDDSIIFPSYRTDQSFSYVDYPEDNDKKDMSYYDLLWEWKLKNTSDTYTEKGVNFTTKSGGKINFRKYDKVRVPYNVLQRKDEKNQFSQVIDNYSERIPELYLIASDEKMGDYNSYTYRTAREKTDHPSYFNWVTYMLQEHWYKSEDIDGHTQIQYYNINKSGYLSDTANYGQLVLDIPFPNESYYIRFHAVQKKSTLDRVLFSPPIFRLRQSSITISTEKGGNLTGGGIYNYGEKATLKAEPDTYHTFWKWTSPEDDSFINTDATLSYTVTEVDRNFVAHFKPKNFPVTIKTESSEKGSVRVADASPYKDQVIVNADGSLKINEVQYDSLVEVAAEPNPGYRFDRWEFKSDEGDTYVNTENAVYRVQGVNDQLIAHFVKQQTITVNVSPSVLFGSVAGGGTYDKGTTITLTATPNLGYGFVGWKQTDGTFLTNSEGVTMTDPIITYTVDQDNTLTAVFENTQKEINVISNPSWGGTVTGSGTYNYGERVTITASPRAGYTFLNWAKEGTIFADEKTYSFNADESCTIQGNFQKNSERSGVNTFEHRPFKQFTGEEVAFDASSIFLHEDNEYDYEWDFGDGKTGSGQTITHDYDQSGEYEVKLHIYDQTHRKVETLTDTIEIVAEVSLAESEFEVNPYGIRMVQPGETLSWDIVFYNNGVPMAGKEITIENQLLDKEVKVTTNSEGYAEYKMTVPSDHDTYSLYKVSFLYESLKRETRIQVYNDHVSLTGHVYDRYTGKPLEDAQVIVGSKTTYTDQDGDYFIQGISSGEHTARVVLEHYEVETLDILFNSSQKAQGFSMQRIIPGDQPFITRAFSTCTNTWREEKFYWEEGKNKDLDFTVDIDWKAHEAGSVKYIIGEQEYIVDLTEAADKNRAVYTFDVGDDIPVGEQLKVLAISAHGVESDIVDTGITVRKPLPMRPNTTSLDLFDTKTPPAPDNMPLISAFANSLIAKGVKGSMSYDEVEGIMVFEVNPTKLPLKGSATTLKSIKHTYSDMGFPSRRLNTGGVSVKAGLGTKVVYKYDNDKQEWALDEGWLIVVALANKKFVYYYLTPYGIPIYVSTTFGVDLESITGIEFENNASLISGSIEPDIYARIAGGAGISDAISAEVWGKLLGALKFKFDSDDVHSKSGTDWKIEVSIGYKLVAFLTLAEEELGKHTWKSDGYDEDITKISNLSMPDVQKMKPMGRAYLDKDSEWLGSEKKMIRTLSVDGKNVSEMILQNNIFPYGEPKISMLDNKSIAVWLRDDPARSDMDRTAITYSIYDGNTWSMPEMIHDDQTADFYPQIAQTSEGLVATWMNTNSLIDKDKGISDFMAKSEIAVATYNKEKEEWTEAQNLTFDNQYDNNPQVAAKDHEAMVVWVKNTDEDIPQVGKIDQILYHESSKNNIMVSKWNGISWSSPENICSNAGAIIKSSLAFDGDKAIYAYILDEDASLETTQDQELYVISYSKADRWGHPVRVTNNDITDANPKVHYLNGEPMIFWYEDGKILYIKGLEQDTPDVAIHGEGTSVLSDFELACGQNGSLGIVWGEGLDKEQEIFTAIYDPIYDRWSKGVQVTDNDELNRSIDAVLDDDGNLLVIYNKAATEETDETVIIKDEADLAFSKLKVGKDFAITREDIVLSQENPMPGSTVTITANVSNLGELAEKDIQVALYDGDPSNGGTLIEDIKTITDPLAGGDQLSVSVEWRVPDQFISHEIYVVVDPNYEKSDRDRTNNKVSLGVMKPDLEITQVDTKSLADHKYVITVKWANRGGVPSENTSIVLKKNDENGVEIASKTIGIFKPGQEIENLFTCQLDESDFNEGIAKVILEIDSYQEDFNELNNVREMILNKQQIKTSEKAIEQLILNQSLIRLYEGESESLVETIIPVSASSQNIRWVSEDEKIAAVDDTGKVTGREAGITTIYAETLDGSIKSTMCSVNVAHPASKPTITLKGEETIKIVQGDNFVDPGATAKDGWGNNLDGKINSANQVDASQIGVYKIIYICKDDFNNEADPKIRTVWIVPPKVNITVSENTIHVTDALPLSTLKLYNSKDEIVTSCTLRGTDNGYTFKALPVEETYYVTQTINGVESDISNKVDVDDTIPPVITLNGARDIKTEVKTSYIELGATATDNLDKSLDVNITGSVDINRIGNYPITYKAQDCAGNEAALNRRIQIVDTTSPQIVLNGESVIQIQVGQTYHEPGAVATDNYDDHVDIHMMGTVDTSQAGEYRITYKAADCSNNAAEKIRTIHVLSDITPPVIKVNGEKIIKILKNKAYKDLGATATDNIDGDISKNIMVTGVVNTQKVGDYSISYSITDSSGNSAKEKRTIQVVDKILPVTATKAAADIKSSEGTLKGEIIEVGTLNSTAYGFVWGTNHNPTVEVNEGKIDFGAIAATGVFEYLLTGLKQDTIYYARTYIIHEEGIVYGNEINFRTLSDNTNLSELIVSEGSLDLIFNKDTTNYTVTLENAVEKIKIRPTIEDSKGKIKVNGVIVASGNDSKEIALAVGKNTITVEVTAEDGTGKNYMIDVNRRSKHKSSKKNTIDRRSRIMGTNTNTAYENIIQKSVERKDDNFTEKYSIVDNQDIKKMLKELKESGEAEIEIALETNEDRSIELNIEKDVIQNAKEFGMKISMNDTILEIPQPILETFAQSNENLNIAINQSDTALVEEAMNEFKEVKNAKTKGTPTNIETDLKGNTKLTIPLDGVVMPNDSVERQTLLDQLAVFAIHSDGEKEMIEATIVYDDNHEPIAITFTTDKFSIFAVVQRAGKIEKSMFQDIKGHWAEENIKQLVNDEVINGYLDGTFRPNNQITRAEFVAILMKALDLKNTSSKVFEDTINHWAKAYIDIAATHKIVTGYNEKEFAPDEPITREQLAVMIYKAIKLNQVNDKIAFEDNEKISQWAKKAVKALKEAEIISGYEDQTFKPKNNASRAEAVTIIMKALKRQ